MFYGKLIFVIFFKDQSKYICH